MKTSEKFHPPPSQTMQVTIHNPHLTYLKSRPPAHLFGRVSLMLPWVGLCGCASLMALLTNIEPALGLWQILAVISAILSIIIPALLASVAASSTATDIINGYYPLLTLTPLSDRQLARSYFYAVLWRVRGGVALLLILMGFVAMGTVWLAVVGDVQEHPFTLLILWGSLIVQLVGWCWAMVAIGVAVGLRYQYPSLLGLIMPLLTLLLLGGSAFITALPLIFYANTLSRWDLLLIMAITLAPYVVLRLALYAGDYSARRTLELWAH